VDGGEPSGITEGSPPFGVLACSDAGRRGSGAFRPDPVRRGGRFATRL